MCKNKIKKYKNRNEENKKNKYTKISTKMCKNRIKNKIKNTYSRIMNSVISIYTLLLLLVYAISRN